ncbi:MAG: tetratricopeptide repeat protein [Pirellulales bacterium]|nr:tetratricopeptide repeat protein [Pirellulales bacterium]
MRTPPFCISLARIGEVTSNMSNVEWLKSVRVRTAQASRHFQDADFPACRSLILELQAEGVDTPLARVGLATLDYIDEQFDAAVDQLQRAEQMGRAPARVWELIGRLYLRLRRTTEGSRALDRAIVMEPGCASAHHARGLAYLLSGDPAAADREFRDALQCGAQSFEAHYHLGIALQRQQRVDEAVEAFKAAVSVAPAEAAAAHRRLADLLERRGQGAFAQHHRALAQRCGPSRRPWFFDVEWLRQGLAT